MVAMKHVKEKQFDWDTSAYHLHWKISVILQSPD